MPLQLFFALGRYFPIELGINNDAKKFLENLSSLISLKKLNHKNSAWVNNFFNEKNKYYKNRDNEADTND